MFELLVPHGFKIGDSFTFPTTTGPGAPLVMRTVFWKDADIVVLAGEARLLSDIHISGPLFGTPYERRTLLVDSAKPDGNLWHVEYRVVDPLADREVKNAIEFKQLREDGVPGFDSVTGSSPLLSYEEVNAAE